MPKYNADEAFEPIEITLDGKNYVITSLSQETLEQIREMSGKEGEGEADYKVVYAQLGLLLSCPPEEFIGKDIRKLTGILRYIQKSIQDQVESKNA